MSTCTGFLGRWPDVGAPWPPLGPEVFQLDSAEKVSPRALEGPALAWNWSL